MKIVIIRHGEPDYSIDSLTKKGKKEARSLFKLVKGLKPDKIYCSPLGRAKLTATLALKLPEEKLEILPWLQEFGYHVDPNAIKPNDYVWDKYPNEWTKHEELFSYETWEDSPAWHDSEIKEKFNFVKDGLYKVLEENGYKNVGKGVYKAKKSNSKTIVFFCHFGLECIILSHLFNLSPQPILQFTMALPSSVTTIVTEERQKGIACFRLLSFGDLSHLYKKNIKPSFSGRYCETFDSNDRH